MNGIESFKKLVDILQAETNIYAHLLQLVEQEKIALVSAKVSDLNEINIAKEAMIARIAELETERLPVSLELGKFLKLTSVQPRLKELADKLDSLKATELLSYQKSLNLLVERITEVNKENEALADSALQNIKGAMGSIKDSFSGTPVYKKEGAISKGSVRSGKIVSREA